MSWKRIFRRGNWDKERADELQSHLEIEADQNISKGMREEEARFAANRKLGNTLQIREEIYRMNSVGFLETVWQDVKYGLRTFASKPGFTIFAIAVLATGIAGTTSIFSLANAVLLRALPYKNADQLVMVWEDASYYGFQKDTPAPGNFISWKTQNHVFEDMAAMSGASFNLTGDGPPEQIVGNPVTANFFSVLGVSPFLGRDFQEAEDHPDVNRVAIVTYGLWLRRFGGDPQVIGRQILLSDRNYTVIGVMPRGFKFAESDVDLWVPMGMSEKTKINHDSHYLQVVARLKPGVTAGEATANLETIAAQLSKQMPESNEHVGAFAMPLRDFLVGKLREAIYALLGAVAFVLLIACANVANLLLARASGRQREMALRMTLGAGRWRIIRQVLTESILLSGVAGGIGLVLSVWSAGLLTELVPSVLPDATIPGINGGVLAFTVGVSLATAILFGIVPALRVSRLDLNKTLKAGTGRGSVGVGSSRTRDVLVALEFALAIILFAGAGLMIRSFLALRRQDAGFRADNIIVFRTPLPRPRYADQTKSSAFFDQVLARIQSLPGVVSVGCASWVPLTNFGGATGVFLEGQTPPPPGQAAIVKISNVRLVNDKYLQTLSVPLKQGRWLDERDNAQATPVAIVNQTAANQIWPGKNPLGLRFKLGTATSKNPWVTIVGIAGDMHQSGLARPPRPEIYFPYSQQIGSGYDPSYLIVKTAGDSSGLVQPIREQVWAVDKEQPVAGGFPLSDLLDDELAPRRTQANLFGIFAGLALVLAAMGIYAVLSFAVTQRTQEIGIRMALGAQSGNVMRMVFGEGLKMMAAGIAVGLICAIGLTRVVSHLLFGVAPLDPVTFIGVPIILATVGVAACWIPARRATRVDPMFALRYE
jgi:putative ABC transport system permease protein